jgi:hypothetical protein
LPSADADHVPPDNGVFRSARYVVTFGLSAIEPPHYTRPLAAETDLTHFNIGHSIHFALKSWENDPFIVGTRIEANGKDTAEVSEPD